MTEKQFNQLKADAEENIYEIDIEGPITEKIFLHMGASMGILAYEKMQCGQKLSIINNPITVLSDVEETQDEQEKILYKKDNLVDKLKDARQYYKLWKETGIEGYRNIAKDDLEHFSMLYSIALRSVYSQKEKDRLDMLRGKYTDLVLMLE